MTLYDPRKHHRQSIRLRGYDYSQAGIYYLTACTSYRECLFGKILGDRMDLAPAGHIVAEEWLRTTEMRDEIELDEWVIMPNHIHGIVLIAAREVKDLPIVAGRKPVGADDSRVARSVAPPAPGPCKQSVGALMAGFKSAATKRINQMRRTPGVPVWQRNYYEHIIRNQASLGSIRAYIAANPANWAEDEENPVVRAGQETKI
jgi:REP element-mobilizing transposase RayT